MTKVQEVEQHLMKILLAKPRVFEGRLRKDRPDVRVMIDRDGDRWERQGDADDWSMYDKNGLVASSGWAFARVVSTYGPCTEVVVLPAP
jgi:hypothetical protein